jgi:diaminohydroxyphosphoribosylaminopyrimidine deaminase/5-amino-6-(5-phosphoribosylamino)uracil reductase
MQDPNPLVSGQGIAKLREAGLKVEFSRIEYECRDLNRGFIKRMLTGLPWLTLKMASTLDGRIADRHGNSRWISGPEARLFVHQMRNTHDCVLIGGTTAVIDDPELNVREVENGRDPHRAVIDLSLQVSPKARLCQHKDGTESWTAIFSSPEKIRHAHGYPDRVKLVEVAEAPEKGGISILGGALLWLAQNDVQSVLCEGGGRLAASLFEERLVDEIFWIVTPKLFVDQLATPSLAGEQCREVQSIQELDDLTYTQLGRDMLVRGKLRSSETQKP